MRRSGGVQSGHVSEHVSENNGNGISFTRRCTACTVVGVAMCLRHGRTRYDDATRVRLDDARPVVYTTLFDEDSVASRQQQPASVGSRRSRTCRPVVVQAQPGQSISVTVRRSCLLTLSVRLNGLVVSALGI